MVMINYSIFQSDFVFKEWEDFKPQYEIIEMDDGIKVQIERLNKDEVKIIQILSSDPQDYLNNSLVPGNIIKSRLQLL